MTERFLILGVGNKDRADDGVGPLAAEALIDLREKGFFVSPHNGEGVSLMDLWQGAELAIIVDAMKSGAKPGTIRLFDAAQDRLEGGVFRYSSHLFSLAEAVEMARVMDRLPQKLLIFGIEGADFTFGAPMTGNVKTRLKKVISQIRQLVAGESSNHA